MHKARLSRTVLVGAAVLGLALAGGGLAIAADSGHEAPVLTPVDGAKPVNSVPGVAIPIGPVTPNGDMGGVTTAK